MSDTFLTFASPITSLYKVNGSKFIGYGYAVYSENEVKEKLEEVKQEHPQARHRCYAYALGKDREKYRVNDDGEPSGTAGKPIYGQILSHNLTNILIVSVRYSNGTKLGVGGLINAYKTSASESIKEANIIEKTVNDIFEIQFDYLAMNDVMSILKKFKIEPLKQQFENSCFIKFEIRVNRAELIKVELVKVDSLELNHLKAL